MLICKVWNVEAIHHWFPVVPRPFACVCVCGGGGGGGSYNLFSHARDSQEKLGIWICVDTFRILDCSLSLYVRIHTCTTD